MENTPQHIDEIRKAFAAMKDKGDLVDVLNMAKPHLYGAKAKDIPLKRITYFAHPRLAHERYRVFQIPKKSGGVRTIHAPAAGLKAILRCLNFVLQCVYEKHFTPATTGFVPGKSIVDNARRHTGKQFVFNLDLKDFFPSVDLYRVKAVLGLPPFNLKDEREPLAYLIANLCCQVMEVERNNDQGEIVIKSLPVLPQGAPTSPILSNVVCYRLDRHLRSVAKRFGATYSRYADDITFSGNYDIYEAEGNFVKEVRRIIQEERFIVNEKKVRLQRPWYRQEVTGLIVNKQPNVPRDYVKQVRRWIYLWETYGQAKSELIFKKDYLVLHPTRVIPPLERVLEGKLQYMRMVVGKAHPTYRKLWERFEELAGEHLKPDAKELQKVKMPKFTIKRNNSNARGSRIDIEKLVESNFALDRTDFLLKEEKIEKDLDNISTRIPFPSNSTEKSKDARELPNLTNTTKDINAKIIKKAKGHNPQHTSNLLFSLYNNPIIKSALHKWDDVEMPEKHPLLIKNFHHQKFIAELRIQINKIKKRYSISKGLNTKLGYFFVEENLFTKDNPDDMGWSMDKVLISWNSKEVQKWCNENPGKWPAVYPNVPYEGLVFDPAKEFGAKKYYNFGDIIQKFIHEIRFKKTEFLNNDPKVFFDILFDSNKYDIENLIAEGIEFYADVEKFRQGIDCIKRGIDENISQSNKIKFFAQNNIDNIILEIHHINSKMEKDIVSFISHSGNTIGRAKELLASVCDWHIEAEFADGCFRCPILTPVIEEKFTKITTDKSDIGLRHIFTFYRPKIKS